MPIGSPCTSHCACSANCMEATGGMAISSKNRHLPPQRRQCELGLAILWHAKEVTFTAHDLQNSHAGMQRPMPHTQLLQHTAKWRTCHTPCSRPAAELTTQHTNACTGGSRLLLQSMARA